MGERSENDEIVSGVRLNDQLIGRLQSDGGPEVAEAERDGTAEVDIAGVPEKTHPSVGPVLDHSLRRRRFALIIMIHFHFQTFTSLPHSDHPDLGGHYWTRRGLYD